ncbi:hypothetical protein [Acidaminococcus timonensis]|uniref:hypothetical protein n=1 Tax=Acidaminococcus timonensis TaxID=1871002 RepID=UPI002942A88A|nr:hypothetical protein [Acidaminococcus timonensis]
MASDLKAEQLGKKVLIRFTRRIVDQVFLFIQDDPELLREYQEVVRESTPNGVNSVLGRMITEAYDLINLNKEKRPESRLLKKYTRHAVRWEKEDLQLQKKVMYGDQNLFSLKPVQEKKEKKPRKRGPEQESLF